MVPHFDTSFCTAWVVLKAHNAYRGKSPDSHPYQHRLTLLLDTLPEPWPGERTVNHPALLPDEPKLALTCRCFRKSRAICTFCSRWKRIRPFSRGCKRETTSFGSGSWGRDGSTPHAQPPPACPREPPAAAPRTQRAGMSPRALHTPCSIFLLWRQSRYYARSCRKRAKRPRWGTEVGRP